MPRAWSARVRGDPTESGRHGVSLWLSILSRDMVGPCLPNTAQRRLTGVAVHARTAERRMLLITGTASRASQPRAGTANTAALTDTRRDADVTIAEMLTPPSTAS